MSITRCPDCNQMIDTDFNADHFPCVEKDTEKKLKDYSIEEWQKLYFEMLYKYRNEKRTSFKLLSVSVIFFAFLIFLIVYSLGIIK